MNDLNPSYNPISLADFNALNGTANPGDFYFIQDTSEFWVARPDDGELVKVSAANGPSMSLYDLNKSIIAQLPEISPDEEIDIVEMIAAWANKQPDDHFMLLSHDIKYYTLFEAKNKKNLEFIDLGEAVVTCIKDGLGPIHSVTLTDQNSFEFWTKYEEDFVCLYLFPYSKGVVYYRR